VARIVRESAVANVQPIDVRQPDRIGDVHNAPTHVQSCMPCVIGRQPTCAERWRVRSCDNSGARSVSDRINVCAGRIAPRPLPLHSCPMQVDSGELTRADGPSGGIGVRQLVMQFGLICQVGGSSGADGPAAYGPAIQINPRPMPGVGL
jgi:hypothetical protein